MKKKKIILITAIAAVMLVCVIVAVVLIVLGTREHVHKFGEWETVRAASCTDVGLERRYCSCGEKDERAITRLGHDFSTHNICYTCGYEIPVSSGLDYRLSSDGNSYSVALAKGEETLLREIYVPRYRPEDGLPVDRVAENGFVNSSVEKIYLPDGLSAIGVGAFHGCANLTECGMSIALTEIGTSAFSECRSLQKIEIAPNVAVGGLAFSGCIALESVTIPDTVTSLGISAFKDCTALSAVSIGAGIATLPSNIFENCVSLVSVDLGKNLGTIGASAFAGCAKLSDVTVHASLSSIGGTAFRGCSGLKNFRFDGTMKEWIAVKKEGDWLANIAEDASIYIRCSDGILNQWDVEVTL